MTPRQPQVGPQGRKPAGSAGDRGHTRAGELRGQVPPLLACSKASPFPAGPKGHRHIPGGKAGEDGTARPLPGPLGHCHGPLCLSQIPLPGPSTEPWMATTMPWMCHRSPPLPALGTSPREWHRGGGSVSSPQVRGLTAALSPLQRHSMAGFGCGGGQGSSSRCMGAAARPQVGPVRGDTGPSAPMHPSVLSPRWDLLPSKSRGSHQRPLGTAPGAHRL